MLQNPKKLSPAETFHYPVIWERMRGKAGPEIQVQTWGEAVTIAACTILILFFLSVFL